MTLIKKSITDYYTEKYLQFGDSPKGVDWKNLETQQLRLKIIVDELCYVKTRSFSILDVGCGTGALYESLKERIKDSFSYTGVDYVSKMLEVAVEKYKVYKNVKFYNMELKNILEKFDFVVASGIFNVKMTIREDEWISNMKETLKLMFSHCTKAMVFNVLTNLVDYTEDRLFYSDPNYMLTFCQNNISRFIKLNHGYHLYEYTMTVYTEEYIKSLS